MAFFENLSKFYKKQLMINKLFLLIIIILLSFSASAIEKEEFYSIKFCEELSGQNQFKLKDLSRVDCLTETHAFEVDWADGMKAYEAIGQSLYYASQTGKKPDILLLQVIKYNSLFPYQSDVCIFS